MTTTPDEATDGPSAASVRAKGNVRRGKVAEQAVARYLRQWWPGAVRAVRTASSAAADPGDIAGVPGVIVSVKDCAREQLPAWMAELTAMRIDDPLALGLLVVKRRGHADPGGWWCHLMVRDFASLCGGELRDVGTAPVRVELATAVSLLRRAGYVGAVA